MKASQLNDYEDAPSHITSLASTSNPLASLPHSSNFWRVTGKKVVQKQREKKTKERALLLSETHLLPRLALAGLFVQDDKKR